MTVFRRQTFFLTKKKISPPFWPFFARFWAVLGRFGPFWVVLGQGGTGGSKNEHKIRKQIAADPMTAGPGGPWIVLTACQTLAHENDVE